MKRFVLIITLLFFTILIVTVQNCLALTIKGKVIDDNNLQVKYKRVYIGGYKGQTDVNGNFVIWIDPGRYSLRVEGYRVTEIEENGASLNQPIIFRPRQERSLKIKAKSRN